MRTPEGRVERDRLVALHNATKEMMQPLSSLPTCHLFGYGPGEAARIAAVAVAGWQQLRQLQEKTAAAAAVAAAAAAAEGLDEANGGSSGSRFAGAWLGPV